ncbi:hypothetical protein [Anaerospora sp.]|uniref:hypothetical protein n=1 Tax=Anaerospora sp. TaxID=1960278 RepID=UPI0028996929|nr:hypothetical protein [Anaerospora sp.]
MNNNYRRYCLKEIIGELNLLDSTELEAMGHIILEDICQKNLLLRGHTVEGESVGYTLDSYSGNAEIVGEYSRQKNYFDKGSKFKKIMSDIKHSIFLAPQVKIIYLISNQIMSPSAGMSLTRLCYLIEKYSNRYVEIYDARRIAEYIVDHLFIKERVIQKIVDFLPLLSKLRDMQTITNALPSNEKSYIKRKEEESEVINRLSDSNHLLIAGISGIGKTSLVINICHNIKQDYDVIVWLDGKEVNIDNLKSVSISRLGINQNLVGLLGMHKTLIVIDSLENDAANIINTLTLECKVGSKVLATTQIEDNSINCYTIKFMSKGQSKNILNKNLDVECPVRIFDKIIQYVGGHPLILSLINASISLGEQTWEDVEEELCHLPQYEDNNSKRICDRIIEKHKNSIGFELSAIKWLDTSIIDYGVLKKMIGKVGISKLSKRSLTTTHTTNGIKIHDIVFNSITQVNIEYNDFTNKLIEYFEEHVERKNSIFFKALYTHKMKITEILYKKPKLGIILYCYLHIINLGELDEQLISKISYNNFLDAGYIYCPHDYFALISLIELIEVERREFKYAGKAYPQILAEDRINQMILCTNIVDLPEDIKIEITHHLGKFYKQALNDENNAIACFNEALKNPKTEFAARLQLSRIIKKANITEAKKYIREILDTYKIDQDLISPTTVLGAFEELRMKEYNDLKDEYLYNTSLLEDALFSNYHESFDQPFRVLANLSGHLTYRYPERVKAIIQQMPIPSEESINPQWTFVAGELYKELGKSSIWDASGESSQAINACNQARAYYSKVKKPTTYQCVKIAENFILLSNGKEAIKILLQVKKEDRDPFWYYRYAQALELDDSTIVEALKAIDMALDMLSLSNYESSFRREKAKILRKIGNSDFIEEYKTAYQLADTHKFKSDIVKECAEIGINLYE